MYIISVSDYISFSVYDPEGKCSFIKYYAEKDKAEIALKLVEFDDGAAPIFPDQLFYLNAERFGPRVCQGMDTQLYANTGTQGKYMGFALASNPDFPVEEERRLSVGKSQFPKLNKQVEYWLDFCISIIQGCVFIHGIAYTVHITILV